MKRRFPVVTHGISPDLKRIHPDFGRINRGDVTRAVLLQVLENYRQLDNEWGAFISRFEVEAETGRFVIRSADKQLTLAAADQTAAPAAPLTVEKIIARLEQPMVISVAPVRPPPEPVWRSVATIVLLCAGLALGVLAFQRKAEPPADDQMTGVVLVTEPADAATRQKSITGLFATGQAPGDRHITISAKGHVVFAEFGMRQSLGTTSDADSFRIGLRDGHTCLVTSRSGVIEAAGPNILVYYGDTYRRVE